MFLFGDTTMKRFLTSIFAAFMAACIFAGGAKDSNNGKVKIGIAKIVPSTKLKKALSMQ